jgi:dTDP-4-amino-4,6-dideoxygalactose transaminase
MAETNLRRQQEIQIKPRTARRRPGRASFLPFCLPLITEEEIQAVADTLRSGWITTGPKTQQFESAFAAYLGVEEALALNSCTAGLHLALQVLGIGPGDQVITTPITFCASANVIEHVGAETVLVDVEPHTMNIDPNQIAKAITPSTRAIIAVHFAGHPVHMRDLMSIARERGLFVIEDAAHAVAAEYQGRLAGTLGDLAAFSFYATKNLTTAEGGMLVGSPDYMEQARILGLHGMSRDAWKRYSGKGSWWYEVVRPGFKYNMTDIQAALGLVQLQRLPQMQQRRREIVRQYTAAFMQLDELDVPVERADGVSAWHLYVLRLRLDRLRIDRGDFIEQLKARNIGASVHFIPIHIHPYYCEKYGWTPYSFPTAYQEFRRVVSLPLYPAMSDDDVADVIAAVTDIVEEFRCPSAFSTSRSAAH